MSDEELKQVCWGFSKTPLVNQNDDYVDAVEAFPKRFPRFTIRRTPDSEPEYICENVLQRIVDRVRQIKSTT